VSPEGAADSVDLNCDMGESFGAWRLGADADVMPSITSASIACGFHAGDPGVMRDTVRLAADAGVAVGAHPGFQDLAGFGRREMRVSSREIEDMLLYQIGALAGIARSANVPLKHVKPHGALYNMAVRDPRIADAIARAVAAFDSTLILFGLAGSVMLDAGRNAGLRVAAEGFADRSYEPDGSLTPRSRQGAVLHDPVAVAQRAVQMVRDRAIDASDGTRLQLHVDTICVHGDTPGADISARELRRRLRDAGIMVRAIGAER
jgi:UPF0271 protein